MLSEPSQSEGSVNPASPSSPPPLRGFVGIGGGGGGEQQQIVHEIELPEAHQMKCVGSTDDFMNGYQGREIPGGRDMGVFDLEDKSIQPHYKGESTCYYSPPLWLIPTLPVK
ncbi:hypothetical protein AQUCO_00700764v1 [Aquilegia coerulea]|uniref:Uncharacterized protein n=1 Tax=Aquilegia coerulea TaxID=218851 RepID=A0A2G5ELJ4_AQUCA|nr:hypothetical protein AQUCO_00700764v1 [Aquilegia coerulea]